MSFGHLRRHFEDNQRRPLSEVAPPADLAPAHRLGAPRLPPAGAAS